LLLQKIRVLEEELVVRNVKRRRIVEHRAAGGSPDERQNRWTPFGWAVQLSERPVLEDGSLTGESTF
jgi:hypothetical protein